MQVMEDHEHDVVVERITRQAHFLDFISKKVNVDHFIGKQFVVEKNVIITVRRRVNSEGVFNEPEMCQSQGAISAIGRWLGTFHEACREY